MENKSKKSQFYIISAVIIAFVILTLASVSNYVSVRQQPEKILQLNDVLKMEGEHVLENAEYNKGNADINIKKYIALFSQYLQENTQEDVSMTILYGDVNSDTVKSLVVTRSSFGNVVYDTGNSFTVEGIRIVTVNSKNWLVTTTDGRKTATVKLEAGSYNITTIVPVLDDNNFILVMTTSDGANRYVQDNLPKLNENQN